MRPLDEALQYGEERGGFVTLLLQHCKYISSCKTVPSKSRKSLESRTRHLLQQNTLTEDQFRHEHWRDVTATFAKEGLESRCEQKCEKSPNLTLKFSHAKSTLSRKRKWIRNSIDYESSDAVKLKQLGDQIV